MSTRQIADRALPSVVLVETYDSDGNPLALGSGFFVGGAESDLVATNLHVFRYACDASIRPVNKPTIFRVKSVEMVNRARDLCLLRVEGTGNGLRLSPDSVKTGDDVFVLGNPEGLEGTLSKGIVSAIRTRENLIQIDAAISHGSSGGPALNSRAEVIGVAVASIVDGQNLNFAVPVRFLQESRRYRWTLQMLFAMAMTDRQEENLRGNVKAMRVTFGTFSLNRRTGRYESSPIETAIGRVVEYDRFGNQTLSTLPLQSGGVLQLRREWNDQAEPHRYWSRNGDQSEEGLTDESRYWANRFVYREYSVVRTIGADVMVYDSKGRLVEETRENGVIRRVHQHNAGGDVVETRDYVRGEVHDVRRYRYRYDSIGNWIEKVEEECEYIEGDATCRPTRVELRAIEYF